MSASVSSPVSPAPTPPRPAGVVVAAVVLALVAFMVLIGSGVILLAAFLAPIPAGAHAWMARAVIAGMGVGGLLISGFCAWTVVDLFRMRRWARISITVLGTLLALFSVLMSLLYIVLAFSTTTYLHKHPGVSYTEFKAILLGSSVFYLGIALIGVWWLIYFSLSRTRRAFAAERDSAAIGLAAGAQIETVSSELSKPRPNAIGILVNCLGALYLVSVLFEAATALLGFPPLFFGHVFSGRAGQVTWIVLGVVSIGIGIGLIRRVKAAWVAAVVFTVLGAISEAMLLTAYGQEQMLMYQQRFGHAAAANEAMAEPFLYIGAIGGILMMAAVLWLLAKARPLFEKRRE